MILRISPDKQAIQQWLRRADWVLGPLAVEKVEFRDSSPGPKPGDWGVQLALRWQDRRFQFGVEIERLWTPKAIAAAADAVVRRTQGTKLNPLIVTPYLADERLRELESRGVSGLDLCGNGVISVPGELLVFRSGAANRFRWATGIKNIWRGASAIVARTLLVQAEFASVGTLRETIRQRGGSLAPSTVSKALQNLEDELIVERTGPGRGTRGVRLLQPDKLLQRLRENYAPPPTGAIVTGKYIGPDAGLVERLGEAARAAGVDVVLSGACSAAAYAAMAREPLQTYYCTEVASLRSALGAALAETERFATLRFVEVANPEFYFDRRENLTAPPVQAYLELAAGDKREQETAAQVRQFILSSLNPASHD